MSQQARIDRLLFLLRRERRRRLQLEADYQEVCDDFAELCQHGLAETGRANAAEDEVRRLQAQIACLEDERNHLDRKLGLPRTAAPGRN